MSPELTRNSNIAGIGIEILSSTNNLLRLHLTVESNVLLGSYPLTISTSLGISTVNIEVLPAVTVYPGVVVIAPGNSQSIAISLTATGNTERSINLQTTDPSIATVTPATITLAAGQASYTEIVTLSGLTLGQTQLILSSPDIVTQSIPVYINPPTTLSPGDHSFYSPALGIVHQGGIPPNLALLGPFITQLGVQKGGTGVTPEDSPRQLESTQIGIVRGSMITNTSPDALLSGSNNELITISGAGLSTVDDVVIYPEEGITVGGFTSTADGTEISFPVSLSQQQAIGPYQVQLFSVGKRIQAVTDSADIFYVVNDLPIINYLEPIVIARDSRLTLQIVGSNFEFVKNIRIEPDDGITMASSFTVNPDATEITQEILVDITATLGERIVVVETIAGESSTVALENNTIIISNAPGTQISSIQSAALGIIKQQTEIPDDQTFAAHSSELGIVIGSYISTISPSKSSVDKSITLTVTGVGLQTVNSAIFEPDEGLGISNLMTASDGLSLTFDLSIDPNAPQVQRQLILSTATGILLALAPNSDRFDVLAIQPVISSVFPQDIAVNAIQIPVTVTGTDLDNTLEIRFEPAEGINVDSFSVEQQGRRITMIVSTSINAQPGARLLIVETTAGQSSNIPSLSNTVTIANTVSTISSLVSPNLGIQKGVTEPPPNEFSAFLTSPMLGVVRQFNAPPDINTIPLYSSLLGVSVGAVATQISPNKVSIGKSADITVSGVGLDTVTTVNFEPPEGIVITGEIIINSNGEQLIIPVQIAEDAEQTLRELVLTTNNNPIRFAEKKQGQLLIAGLTPEIISLDPIQQTQGASFTLLIRGINLDDTLEVAASPSTGISFTTPSINTAGTELTITMIISSTAPPGPRVITVTTPAGSTENNAIPANTFTIIN